MALKNPDLPAGVGIKKLPGGGALLSNGDRLHSENDNSWYVLATIYGEQSGEHLDEALATQNRRAWNLWVCQDLSDLERAEHAKTSGLSVADLAPLPDAEDASAELLGIKQKFEARMGQNVGLPESIDGPIFSNTYFSKHLTFYKYVFVKNASFISSTFACPVDFGFVTFNGKADFGFSTFLLGVSFPSATFKNTAYFRQVTFNGFSNFSSANFLGNAFFEFSVFGGNASFASSIFAEPASFSSVTFKGEAVFNPSTFRSSADFKSAKFYSTTKFDGAQFDTAVPEFHAAELYDDTVFPTKDHEQGNWPEVPTEGGKNPDKVMDAAEQKRAYNRLRLFMNKSLQIEEEQFFHRMEMRCKRETESRIYRPVYTVFEVLSDYGGSVMRPVVAMMVMIVLGAVVMFMARGGDVIDWQVGMVEIGPFLGALKTYLGQWGEPVGWSISNSLPFLGLGKLYFGAKFMKGLPMALKIVAGVQTLFGFILLFFLGLGLRNRFRLR